MKTLTVITRFAFLVTVGLTLALAARPAGAQEGRKSPVAPAVPGVVAPATQPAYLPIRLSARPVNLLTEINHENVADGDFYEVFSDALAEHGLLVSVSIAAPVDALTPTPLVRNGVTWPSWFAMDVTRDGEPAATVRLAPVAGSATLIAADLGRSHPKDEVAALKAAESLTTLWRISDAQGAVLAPGRYSVVIRPRQTSDDPEFRVDFRFVVRAPAPELAVRSTEDRIEGHYLTACALQTIDAPTAARHLILARAFVEKLIAEGAGDTTGWINLTPRYQAARICERAGDTTQAATWYALTLQGLTRESHMRHGLFGAETGRLSESLGGTFFAKVKRLQPTTR